MMLSRSDFITGQYRAMIKLSLNSPSAVLIKQDFSSIPVRVSVLLSSLLKVLPGLPQSAEYSSVSGHGVKSG